MQIQTSQKITHKIIFEEEELDDLLEVLNYAWHRASQHQTPISHQEELINKWRKILIKLIQ